MVKNIFLSFVGLLVINIPAESKVREWLEGCQTVVKGLGIQGTQEGEATSYSINKDRSNGTVNCRNSDKICFEVGVDMEKGWYVDIYLKTNTWLPSFDPSANMYQFEIPQTKDEELQIKLIRQGIKE